MDLDNAYEEFIADLPRCLPDGMIPINLDLLNSLDLLHLDLSNEENIKESTHQFYVIETTEKLTLYNQDYVVWIVPRILDHETSTLVLIALNTSPKLHLEIGYTATGAYNSSKIVLGVLNKLLSEIKENQELIVKIEKTG